MSDRKRTKFDLTDTAYLTARQKFAEKWASAHWGGWGDSKNFWGAIDQWPLYVGQMNLARNIAIYEILKGQMDVPGDIVEFGSFRGANLLYMAKLLDILDHCTNKVIHGFEWFEGLPVDASAATSGTYIGNEAELQDAIKLYGFEDRITIHKGDVLKTFPNFLKADEGASFSLIFCDIDVYEPTRVALFKGHERLSVGGVFVCDQWTFPEWPGEGKAVREFLAEHGANYFRKSVRGARQPSLILRRIK